MGTLRQTIIEQKDSEELLKLINSQPEQRIYLNIKVALYEIKKDYAQAFKCLLQSVSKQHKVFDWLKTIFLKLKEQGQDENESDVNKLKIATKMHMRELIQLEISINQKKNDEHIT